MSVLLAIALLALGEAGAASACGEPVPLRAVEGWTHIRVRSLHEWSGILHDGESGALVHYAVGAPSTNRVVYWSRTASRAQPDERLTGTVGGVSYEAVVIRDARARIVATFQSDTGLDPNDDPNLSQALPPQGCPLLVTAIGKEGAATVWSFWVSMCSAEQESRAKGLLLSSAEINNSFLDEVKQPDVTLVSLDDVRRLNLLTTAVEACQMLGPPDRVSVYELGGLTLNYPMASKSAVDLHFDRNRRLVAVRLPGAELR